MSTPPRDNLSYSPTVRSLSQIVTRNALRLVEEADKRAEKEGGSVDLPLISKRMAERMDGNWRSILKQLRRYTQKGKTWRIDYIDAFAQAVGRPPGELLALRPDGDELPEATVAQTLYTGLGARMSPKRARSFIHSIQEQLDDPEVFELCRRVDDAILAAKSRQDASDVIYGLLKKTDVFQRKRRSLRVNPGRRQIVSD